MKKYFIFALLALFVVAAFSQTIDPRPPRTTWKKELDYIKNGQYTMTYKTLTSPTIAGTIPVSGATNYTQVNAASGSANPWDFTGTLGIMNGSDTYQLFDINLTNANHTGGSNTVEVMNIANITGDSEADENAVYIGTGWDYGLKLYSPFYSSSTAAFVQVNDAGGSANPIDYTGTLGIMDGSDDFTLIDVNITNADHTGSNTIQVLDIANITGDAQATENAISIGTGWDLGIASQSGVRIGTTAAETITQVDTIKSAGGVVKWVKFTIAGASFYAVADTARIVNP